MGRRERAFTLIELLVVIAIIAILAAILFPVFTAARQSGRRAACIANLRNIARGLEMYRDANNGRNCSIWQQHNQYGSHESGSWHFAIAPYVAQRLERENLGLGNAGRNLVFRCPSAPWQKQRINVPANSHEGFSYTMNETGWSDIGHGCDSPACDMGISAIGQFDSAFRRPREIIFVGEAMGYFAGLGYANGDVVDNEAGGFSTLSSKNPLRDELIPLCDPAHIGRHGGSLSKIYNMRASHGGKASLLFYDGHVETRQTTRGRNWSIYY